MRCYMPSQERIQEECARIQAGWSPAERASRWVARTMYRLTIRVVDTSIAEATLLEEAIRDLHSWQFIEEPTVKEPALEDLSDVVEEFEPSTVSFG